MCCRFVLAVAHTACGRRGKSNGGGLPETHKTVPLQKAEEMPVKRETKTEVASAEELASLRWHQQGDEAMETVEMLELRRQNRTAVQVVDALEVWWRAVEQGKFGDDLPKQPKGKDATKKGIGRKGYVAAITKVGMALMEECERSSDPQDDISEARSEAEESWLEDSKGSKTLSKKKWLDALFELGVLEREV